MGFFESARSLNQQEKDLANTVFNNSVSFDNVYIGNRTGLGGIPWTETTYDELEGTRFIIHLGITGYNDATSEAEISSDYKRKTRNIFIHELVHVWQGQHSKIPGSYQASSFLGQIWSLITTGERKSAYQYKAGESWDSYNVEQQAKIVEDWFKNGSKEDDDLFKYVKENIRK
jgi:hypothetical protein